MPPRHWLPCRIWPDNILTPKAKHSSTTNNTTKNQTDAHNNNNMTTPAAKIISTMKRTPAKKRKQDGNKDAESIVGQEGQKLEHVLQV